MTSVNVAGVECIKATASPLHFFLSKPSFVYASRLQLHLSTSSSSTSVSFMHQGYSSTSPTHFSFMHQGYSSTSPLLSNPSFIYASMLRLHFFLSNPFFIYASRLRLHLSTSSSATPVSFILLYLRHPMSEIDGH